MLENMLVTERDIFGDNNEMSDEFDDETESTINSNVEDDVVTEPKSLSVEELANIEEEFKKVTALPSGGQSVATTSQGKKPPVGGHRTPYTMIHTSVLYHMTLTFGLHCLH